MTIQRRAANNSAMADILIEREHHLTLDQALAQVDALARLLGRELDARCVWNGHRLEFRRAGARGSVQVTETLLTLEVHLGLFLKPLRLTLEERISNRLDRLIDAPLAL